jgi:hypothetical protein
MGFTAWNPTEFTRIEAGRVLIQGGLSQTGHKLTTLIYSNGSLGVLSSGSPSPFAPRGALIVELGDSGVLVNNTSWDVIESVSAMNVSGLAVALPQTTALRSFSGGLAPGSTRYRVRVTVQPMSAIAAPGIAASYGAALDQMTPVATGAVAKTIAELQAIPTADAVRARLSAEAPALPTRSLATAGAMLDSAMAVTEAAPSLIGRSSVVPGLTLVGSAAHAGAPGRWSAAFNDLPSGNAGVGQGNGIGYASGFTALAGDVVELGMGTMWTTRDARFADGAGRSEATIVTGRLLMAPAPALRAATTIAAGRTRFEGSRTISNGAPGMNRQTGGLLALDSQLAWSPTIGGLNPSLSAAISYRRVDGDGMREGSAGLALLVDRSHWQRAETRVGLSLAPELALGSWHFAPRLGAYWLHRLGGVQDGVEARFAAMPDHRFVLSNGSMVRESLALDGGFSLTSGRWSLNAAATSRADIGGRWTEGRMSLGLSF